MIVLIIPDADIVFPEPVTHEKAVELKAMCPMQVFDIEDIGGAPTAVASRPRDCTMCRECIRHEGWSELVHLRRKADHFIFSVESTGCIAPETIVSEVDALAFMSLLMHVDRSHCRRRPCLF